MTNEQYSFVPTLHIIRGLPGSGKSTKAKELKAANANAVHIEADMFFIVDGEYKFDRTKLHLAHSWCFNTALQYLAKGYDVIVSNTFTTTKELKPYLELSQKLKTEVKVYRCVGDFGNIHNVPEESMSRMRARMVDYPGEEIVGNIS